MISPKSKKNKSIFWAASFVTLITLVAYLPVLKNDFVRWDDGGYIFENQHIRSIDVGLLKWIFTAEANPIWHPITLFSFALEYAIWEFNPLGYHLTNVILHMLNTLIVFILTVCLLKIGGAKKPIVDKPFIVGTITAILFGLHPLHVESVAWVSERKDVLCAFFFLLAIFSYLKYVFVDIRNKKNLYYILSLVLFILALMSKPMAVTLPVVLLILDLCLLERLSLKMRARSEMTVLIEKMPFFILGLLSSLITMYTQQLGGALRTVEEYPLISRLFVAMHSYMFYLGKMILPYYLAPFYPYPDEKEIFTFIYTCAGILTIAITFFSIWSFKRNKTFTAIWLYYIVTLLPVIGIVKISDFAVADRYTYLPSLGPFFLAGMGIGNVFEGLSRRSYKIISVAVIIALAGLLLGKTIRQIGMWHDSATLWTYQASLYPKTLLAYINRGVASSESGNYQMAIADYTKAIELNPKHGNAYFNRGLAYSDSGNYRQAVGDLTKAIELNYSKDGYIYYLRGDLYSKVGDYNQAIADFSKVIELNPASEYAYLGRGQSYNSLGNFDLAVMDFNKSIEFNPRDARAYNSRGIVLSRLRNQEQAIKDFTKAVEFDPKFTDAYFNRGLVYRRSGNNDQAISDFKKVIEINPSHAGASYILRALRHNNGEQARRVE